jgi:ADP-ribose pyrophosphatase YjhB (NUDIX family)
MGKPITPFVGCDVFVKNNKDEVLLIQRADNGLWALPGGCHDLGETPAKCAVRECKEETGYKISISRLLGAWSSNCYEYLNYPWKNNEFCHLVFEGVVIGGDAEISAETIKVGWFKENQLPELSDGHLTRILFGFKAKKKGFEAYYE